jgi:hypothetical protein
MRTRHVLPTAVFVCAANGYLQFAVGATVHVAPQPGAAEQQLIQVERDWCTAQLKKDAALQGRILADDYTNVTRRGTTESKADALAGLKDNTSTVTTCLDRNLKARAYGNAAVVTGLSTRSGTYKGATFADVQALWTDTFVMKGGRWQCVASQQTLIASQQK